MPKEKNTEFQGDEGNYKNKWKREFFKEIANELPITQTTANIPNVQETDKTSLHDFPRWEVLNVTPDKSQPNKNVFLYGNDALMPLQISLVNAIYKMLGWIDSGANGEKGNLIKRAGYPLVKLFFEEDKPSDIASKDFIPVQARLSWRLMDYLEYPNNLGKKLLGWEEIERLSEKIYREFQQPNNKDGYLWEKGKISYNYSDWNNGYGLKILCKTEQIGKEILNKVLSINGHNFNSNKASKSFPENDDDYREGREIMVLGEKQKAPRFRPYAKVRFKNAELLLSKRTQPVKLITRGFLERFPQ